MVASAILRRAAGNIIQPSVSDPYFANVSCLLHFDGMSGSTTITDSGPGALTFTAGGSAALSNAQSKFGGTSFAPGTGWARTTSLSGFQLGSGNFTIEGWVYIPSAPAGDRAICTLWDSGNLGWYMGVGATRALFFYYSPNGSSGSFPASTAGVVPTGAWTHVAVVRNSGTLTFYVNGVSQGTASISGSIFSATPPFSVGADSGTAGQNFPGYIDDLRVTKGVARYTSAFTPPTMPFPDS